MHVERWCGKWECTVIERVIIGRLGGHGGILRSKNGSAVRKCAPLIFEKL